jgi:predicted transcriptional regulator
MPAIESKSEPPVSPPDSQHNMEGKTAGSVDAERLLDVITDKYARSILEALTGCPATAPTLAAELDASKPTVYRRLNSLESVGLIKSTVAVDPDGHHRKRFHIAVSSVEFALGSNGVEITVGD